jgi:hypothetical protein
MSSGWTDAYISGATRRRARNCVTRRVRALVCPVGKGVPVAQAPAHECPANGHGIGALPRTAEEGLATGAVGGVAAAAAVAVAAAAVVVVVAAIDTGTCIKHGGVVK